MWDKHLTYEELERYIDDTDFSQEYLLWSEPMTEHLDMCVACRERLDKLFLLSELTRDENIVPSVRLISRETQLRARMVALRLEIMAENQRMLEVAGRLQMGALLAVKVSKEDFLRKQSVSRGTEGCGLETVSVQYEKGKACVSVSLPEEKKVTVILSSTDVKSVPCVKEATWYETKKIAVAEFDVERLESAYEIYVDMQDK